MAGNDTAFTGGLPQLYDRELAAMMFAPYAADMAARLAGFVSGRLLETAAGTGIVTVALAAALPATVEIVATDLNQPMIDHAATKRGLERVHFQQADATALPFPDQSFDVVVCQFGIMFFPDRVAGMREARRVLKPGGRFLFNAWGPLADNPVMAAVIAGVSRWRPMHPLWFLERTPCGYHDPEKIRADLRDAGFVSATIEAKRLVGRAASADQAAIGFCHGTPLRAEIVGLDPAGLDPAGLDPAGLDAATASARAAVVERFGDGSFDTDLLALVVETTKT